jgi:hypothetical protein
MTQTGGSGVVEQMRIDRDGNVGIGTDSPVAISTGAPALTLNGTNTSVGAGLIFQVNGTTKSYQYVEANILRHQAVTGVSQSFWTNSSEKMRIDTAGNVGIGMTSPNNLLNLQRNVAGGDVAAYIQNFNGDVGSTDETASVKFAHGNDGVVGYVGGKLVCGKEGDFETSIPNIKGNLQFYTASGTSLDSDVNNIERMRITGAGNVGIGTTSPDAKLFVQNPNASTNPVFQTKLDTAYGMGMTNQWVSTYVSKIQLGRLGGSASSNIDFIYDIAGTEYGSIKRNYTVSSLKFERGTTLDMIIDGTGKVGIGITNPAVPLDVEGKIRSNDNNSGDYLEMFNDGSVSGNSFIKSTSGELIIESAADITFSPNSSEKMRITSTGDIELAPSSRIVLDDQPTASTASGSGTIVKWSVSESTTAGLLYVIKTTGGWTTTDADVENRSIYMLSIALSTNANLGMLLQGFFYKSAHGFTIGLPLYISNTAGAFTTTRPTGTNDYVRIIGYATSANYIYFDPDKTWIKLSS